MGELIQVFKMLYIFGKQCRFTTQKERSVCLLGYIWYINPIMPNGISNLYQLDESILNLRVVE